MLFNKKEDFGPFGKLKRKEWEEMLLSGKGSFKRFQGKNRLFEKIKGPGFYQGNLQGYGKAIEENLIGEEFQKHPEEENILKKLRKTNPIAAEEYAFVKTGLYDIWRKDVIWLIFLLKKLEKEESSDEKEEELLLKELNIDEKVKEIEAKKGISEAIKRQLPNVFFEINFEQTKIKENLNEVLKRIEKIEEKKETIKKVLKQLKKEIPVLFHNIKFD